MKERILKGKSFNTGSFASLKLRFYPEIKVENKSLRVIKWK